MSNLEQFAALIFGLCCAVILITFVLAVDSLVQSARRGNESAQVMLFGIGAMALVAGFGWSISVLWPTS